MKLFSRKKDIDFIIDIEDTKPLIPVSPKIAEPAHKLTVDEVLGHESNTQNNNTTAPKPQIVEDRPTTSEAKPDGGSALESLRKRMMGETVADSESAPTPSPNEEVKAPEKPQEPKEETQEIAEKPKPQEKVSLLEKCKPFLTDDSGKDTTDRTPLYKLESVAEILENHRKSSIDRLASQYNITVDDLGKNPPEEKEEAKETESQKENEVIEINAFFENAQSNVPFALSEVEAEIESSQAPLPEADANADSTLTFTPVSDGDTKETKILVSSNTQNINLTGEIAPIDDYNDNGYSQTELENNEFDDYTPKNEITNIKEVKKYIRIFSIKRRRRFFASVLSVIVTLALAFMKLPVMSGYILSKTQASMILCAAFTAFSVLINCDMFISFKTAFRQNSVADICPALASVLVLAYAAAGIMASEIILDMLLLLSIILSVRSISAFKKYAYLLSNLIETTKSESKTAVKLIDDPTITFAMAKDAIDGDALIAGTQKCAFLNDYIKYSTFGKFINGKMPIITSVSLAVALISAIAAGNYFGGLLHGLYAAASILCFASIPTVFLINNFPLHSAAKNLNKHGCMIAGMAGASHIKTANALVLNSIDIFPARTVTLHQMKVLSENDLDKTILRAASLTECLNSPLTNIFKSIAGESNITTFPNSDTIKYEERMGISGWVDNELLFIGNRTLMQAHGIAVPDVEVDYQILRSGYFPVYVANSEKATALLVVQYAVDGDVAHELRKISKSGLTILVNNTDPNINEEMICDYLGLYSDSVMIMTNAGFHMYKNSTYDKESVSAPASFRRGNISVARIVNCANKICRSNTLLTILYIVSAILGFVIFAYSSFAGSGSILESGSVLLYSLICTALSYALYLIEKP